MADNVDVTPGAGKTIATDDVGGIQYQRVKVTHGVDGSATDASSTNPLPVTVPAVATSIAKAEDVASADADVGVPAMAVRKAAPANTSGTDGDYEMLQMSAGRLWASATIDAALPAGTNAIGKLAANSGVDIGDIDVTSIIPGTAATNLGKAEDAAHASGDVGVQMLAVRKATPANLSDADGDYEPLQCSAGRLYTSTTIDAALPAGANAIGKLAANAGVTIGAVEIAAAQTVANVTTVATVTNLSQLGGQAVAMGTGVRSAGTQRVTIATDDAVPVSSVIPGTGATALGKAEDAAHTSGDTGVMMLGVRSDAPAALTNAAGDYSPIAVNSYGDVYTKAREQVTYTAYYRLAARPYALSNVFGAAGTKQFATIFHAAGATKSVRIREVSVAIESASAAAIVMAYLTYLSSATTPATGNPAITPRPHDPAAAAAEATCLALPTTAGTEVGAWLGCAEWNCGITGAGSTANPPPPLTEVVLYSEEPNSSEAQPLIMRAANAEGYAVTIDASAAATIKGYVKIKFTEE